MTEDKMIGWHHRLNGQQFEQAPGVGDGQGGLACCSPWGRKELNTLNNNTVLLFASRTRRNMFPILSGIRATDHGD